MNKAIRYFLGHGSHCRHGADDARRFGRKPSTTRPVGQIRDPHRGNAGVEWHHRKDPDQRPNPMRSAWECRDERQGPNPSWAWRSSVAPEGRWQRTSGKAARSSTPRTAATYTVPCHAHRRRQEAAVRGYIGPFLAAPRPGIASHPEFRSETEERNHVPIFRQQSRRARRWRDGCADCRPPGQRQGAGGAVRPAAGQGRPKNGIVTKAVEGLKKLKPAPLGVADDAVLIGRPTTKSIWSNCATATSSSRPLPSAWTGSWTCTRRSPLRWPHRPSSRPTPRACRSPSCPRRCPTPSSRALRHPLLQPAALHGAGGADQHPTTEALPGRRSKPLSPATLGKGVVRARIPQLHRQPRRHAGMLATMKEVENFGLTFDVVDDLTGKKLGRASAAPSAPPTWWAWTPWPTSSRRCRTPWPRPTRSTSFATRRAQEIAGNGQPGPEDQGRLLQKVGRDVMRFDLASKDYVPAGQKADEVYARMLKNRCRAPEAPAQRRRQGKASSLGHPAQQLPLRRRAPGLHCRQRPRCGLLHALGLRHEAGPPSSCGRKPAGWKSPKWSRKTSTPGKALCRRRCPKWVFKGPVAEPAVCTSPRALEPDHRPVRGPRSLPVYARQHFPESVLGANAPAATAGTTVFEDESIRLWTLDGRCSSPASNQDARHRPGGSKACSRPRPWPTNYQGLVVWSQRRDVLAGADLQSMLPAFMMGGCQGHRKALKSRDAAGHAQAALLQRAGRLAIRGLALGGGCELAVYSSRRVAAMESYIGLVEVGVGLVPGAGG